MTSADVALTCLTALVGLHTAALVALIVLMARTREKVTRLEEWARLEEKRRNGSGNPASR